MGLGWADWIRFILTPLVLGLIAAIVATRNARKTPHERLKNLVDIHDKMPKGLDSRNVVEAAIARELVDFDRRVAADQRGFWAGVKERLVQVNGTTGIQVATTLVFSALGMVVATVVLDDTTLLVPIFAAATLLSLGGTVFIRFSSERKYLNMDRVSAQITATFSRDDIRRLASKPLLPEMIKAIVGDSAASLTAMGVITTEGGYLHLTPFGRAAIQQSLHNADRQHYAYLADVDAAAAARDDESRREAPEQ
ncbi:hypothetical protein [Gordonia rubripertincta]|uniref:DUF2207 domain-containing protein n=1 Tax=Gordonia rubripertincta TaxID=36822 RepID=A0ABT4N704_GORRU|nr:hypothetical protein [Gordonia rubripertincta]MCZ4553672.1 hypothetical protein [Gordonia rubripertincta]